jgi:SAM-dependent methyltransferase
MVSKGHDNKTDGLSDARTHESRAFLNEPEIHTQWESEYLNPDLDRFYDRAFARIIQTLAPKPDQTLLDAGCGYCFHAVRLARGGLQVTGLDFAEAALERSAAVIERAGMTDRIRVQRGDLLNLPFSDGTFDYVHCWGVLMHIPRLETALGELIRVLKPGGKLILMENNAGSLHVQAWERLIRLAKRILRRRLNERTLTPRGPEEWVVNGSGGFLVRTSNIDFLVRFCQERGLRLVARFAGQFTELYTNLPRRALKRAVYKFNEFWFNSVRRPKLALGNVLVFEKSAGVRPDEETSARV